MAVEGFEKLGAHMAVGGAMIRGKRGGHHRMHAEHAILGPGLLHDFAEADNCHLRRIDDAKHGLHTEIAKAGDAVKGKSEMDAVIAYLQVMGTARK